MNLAAQRVLCIGPLTPPVTGATLVTERFLEEIPAGTDVERFNIGATTARGRLWRHPGRVAAAKRTA